MAANFFSLTAQGAGTSGNHMHTPVDIYSDDALVRLYDHFNPWAQDNEFYLSLARQTGGPVLDLGCGTGLAAVRMAEAGFRVVGADPAAGMLGLARTRPGTEQVEWIHAAGQDLALPGRFGLIYMTGHAFQAMLTDEDAVALLRNAGRHLAPGGCFAFETRNALAREWQSWNPAQWQERVEIAEYGSVEESGDVDHDPATGIVTIGHVYRFLDLGSERRGVTRIRFIDQAHLARLVERAGLVAQAYYGWWDKSPYEPESPEIIAVLGKAA
jgi:SAM-dependent methyltransferase